ncbi:amino acid ABC transporter permease [Helicobacter cappadocius]|uniref:Amino acid ABC transporter permease n=1 Tax=Helicobacter cappadocius TaxID=3063998 RepID=A0AA90TBG1_9HELI|nr:MULTISPECIES: amino acid ABC transporter permease [unclassified Helicobacter]MDO7253113.1 amino acid ABC transporter permease [Helicobacter sp. faydin-H75]MDP2538761.1 amino acid ABC transporter permease [Helicobacter sp. faydin-H76]
MIHSIPAYTKGLYLTLQISFWGILIAIVIGFVVATTLYYQVKYLKNISKIYIEISRNTPMLIQLFFLYYGFGQIGFKLEAYECAIISVAFLGGSYMAESFRSGLESISKIQIESGKSLGLGKISLLYHVILPQSLSVSIPYLGANAIFLLKETSVVSAIALVDVMFVTKDFIGTYYKTNEALIMLVLSYLIVLLPMSAFFVFLEHHYRKRL